MNETILCCRTLEPEVRLAMKRCGKTAELIVLQENHHDVPRKLCRNIQEQLDCITDTDRVLMAFTHCGGAMAGLRSGDFQLVIPRVDDCLSLLMGSMEKRKAALGGEFGVFVTERWMNHEKGIEEELNRIYRTYPAKRAERVIRAMYGNFSSLNVIDTGAYDLNDILPRTREVADRLQLKHRIVEGTTEYLEALLQGPHDPARFIVIPSHTTVTESDTWLHFPGT